MELGDMGDVEQQDREPPPKEERAASETPGLRFPTTALHFYPPSKPQVRVSKGTYFLEETNA